jgi:hypothetical protein
MVGVAGLVEQQRGAELAQADSKGEDGRHQHRPADDGQVDLAQGAAGDAPSTAALSLSRGFSPRSAGRIERTTKGMAINV